jgi:hypothetical protein
LLAGCSTSQPISGAPVNNHGWIQQEVADSYVFGYPLVVMQTARDAALGRGGDEPGQAPVNTLRHERAEPGVGAASPSIPDVDTLASHGWLDLAAEPVVVALPDARGRYLGARALDMWSNVIWSTGMQTRPRNGSTRTQTIAFVAPGWTGVLPTGVQRVDTSSKTLWLAVRIQPDGPRDLAAATKLQYAIRVMPLSVYTGHAREAPVAVRGGPADAPPPAAPSAKVLALDANAFFTQLADALRENPPSPDDPHALKMLADIGVKAGEPVALPRGASEAIAAGLASGRARVASVPENVLSVNGWRWLGDDVGHYGKDYALRAYAAYTQPGSGAKEDEVQPTVSVDSDGQPLYGANRYVIHFAAQALPPVHAFWTITPYTMDGAIADTGKSRLSIGGNTPLRRNHDGSLDIYVSAKPPGKAREANWLTAPRSAFKLVMRLYEPKPQASDGTWQPPPVLRQ